MFKQISFILLLFASSATANSPANETQTIRLLGATPVTEEQLSNNFKGSASIAVAYYLGVAVGALIDKDKILLATSAEIGFAAVKVPALTMAYSVQVENEEIYKITDSHTTVPISGRTLATYKFGPLSENSKAVVSTLPPPGSLPPKPGTSECIVYSYNRKPDTTDDINNYVLGYLPLTVVEMSKCTPTFGTKDEKIHFCATTSTSSGTCGYLDIFKVAMCPSTSLNKNYERPVNAEGKIWCKKERLWWWWWWCPEEEVSEPEWILTGLNLFPTGTGHDCNDNPEFVMLFAYTNI